MIFLSLRHLIEIQYHYGIIKENFIATRVYQMIPPPPLSSSDGNLCPVTWLWDYPLPYDQLASNLPQRVFYELELPKSVFPVQIADGPFNETNCYYTNFTIQRWRREGKGLFLEMRRWRGEESFTRSFVNEISRDVFHVIKFQVLAKSQTLSNCHSHPRHVTMLSLIANLCHISVCLQINQWPHTSWS